ncbi:response regulator transcription factor [Massilia sp. TS11]|uniref:response regulator transcription factor n=1 Tax=Massilia sp. TS11 TaxID=2908003 RepID=UPI001EDB11E4|nr:response regulator transcription factor [Massilia sp. TS11]MCG2583590.1 response regulator transcription factor [Massilia sp. TS11]
MKTGLVVDDVPASREWLSAALRRAFPPIALRTADTVQSALAQLRAGAPAVALIDLGLPDGSGVELIQWCSEHAPDTVCVVASIYDDDQHLFPALRAGAIGYLLKDAAAGDVELALRGILDGRPPLSPAIARKLLHHFRAGASAPPLEEALTPREREVLVLIAKGLTLREAADLLQLTANTVAGYVKVIYRKLNVSTRAEAALTARALGLV